MAAVMMSMFSSYHAEFITTSTPLRALAMAFGSLASSLTGVTLFGLVAFATSLTLSMLRSAATTSALY